MASPSLAANCSLHPPLLHALNGDHQTSAVALAAAAARSLACHKADCPSEAFSRAPSANPAAGNWSNVQQVMLYPSVWDALFTRDVSSADYAEPRFWIARFNSVDGLTLYRAQRHVSASTSSAARAQNSRSVLRGIARCERSNSGGSWRANKPRVAEKRLPMPGWPLQSCKYPSDPGQPEHQCHC
jgi:hypothetical protein